MLDEMSISFSVPPHCILREGPLGEIHSSYPDGQWLPGACLNPAKNCLILNRNRSLDDVAVIWRDEGDDNLPVCRMTVRELRAEVWYATFSRISICYVQNTYNMIRSSNANEIPWSHHGITDVDIN